MSAHQFFYDMFKAVNAGANKIEQPASDARIVLPGLSLGILEVDTTESLDISTPLVTNLPVGTMFIAMLRNDGGDLNIGSNSGIDEGGSGNDTVVFDDAGDCALFMLVSTSATTKEWRVLAHSGCTFE